MISWVVCLYRPEVYATFCHPAIQQQVDKYGGEIIEVGSAKGICHAYEYARKQAKFDTIVYLHDDLRVIDSDATERILSIMDEADAGLMGVVGSADGERRVPWWKADRMVGAWCWAGRNGAVNFQQAGVRTRAYVNQRWEHGPYQSAFCLDGVIMCDRTDLPWPKMDGWHGYDVDRSMHARTEGHRVIVGDLLVCHHNQGDNTAPLEPVMKLMSDKWDELVN